MSALAHVQLPALMRETRGAPDVVLGVIDSAIDALHPQLEARVVQNRSLFSPTGRETAHGTFVAGVLGARRDSGAPGICPNCPIVSRPLFEDRPGAETTLGELARAIHDCIAQDVAVINLSVEARVGAGDTRPLHAALDAAAKRGIAVITAAGNAGALEGSPLTEHPWVLPVVACDAAGAPLASSTLSRGIALYGLCAPGKNVTSLGVGGSLARMSGASVGAPFVTGAFALLRTLFPHAPTSTLLHALRSPSPSPSPRRALVPPRMNATAALRRLEHEMSVDRRSYV